MVDQKFAHFQNGNFKSQKPIHTRILNLLKKHKIDYHKIFDQQNKGVPTLGPERDTRAVEGDREGVIEGEGVRVREREREGEVKEKEKEKEKIQILPFNSEAFPTPGILHKAAFKNPEEIQQATRPIHYC